MSFGSLIAITIFTASYLIVVNAQTEKSFQFEGQGNGTITCEINGEKFEGDACLDSLKKFGKIVGYIIGGILIIIVISCCCCFCCICKIIHSNKERTRGVVLQRNSQPQNAPVIATVA